MDIRNKRLTDEEFAREREAVLAIWPTGEDVRDLEEAVAYRRSMPLGKLYAHRLEEAGRAGTTLPYTYNGSPLLEWQLELIEKVQKVGGAGLLTTHVDSMTRNQFWQKAAEAVEGSKKAGKALLNGFPVGVHGVGAARKLTESAETAIMISGTSCDWRLSQEIGMAGGFTASTGDPFFPYFCYNKNTPLETSIRNWQYVYRLRGYYEERGCPIVTKTDGLECALCPPSVEDAARIIAILIAAEQGCRHFLCNMVAGCNLAQDLAEAITLRKLAREYLDRFGFHDAVLYGGIQSWNGRYPWDRPAAYVICMSAPIIAVLAKLEACCLFTIDEAHEIPTVEAQIATLQFANMFINLYKDQKFDIENRQVKEEAWANELEVRSIIDKVIEMGDGDVAVGMVRAVAAGMVDGPFVTPKNAARKVMGVRDAQGAGRFLDTGNLPFPREIKEFHRQKIAERSVRQGGPVNYDTVVQDILSISKGYLV